MAEEVATVKIKSDETEQGFMIINQDAFDPGSMQLWYEPGTEPAVEELPSKALVSPSMETTAPHAEAIEAMTHSEPSGDALEPGRRGRRGA